MSYFYTSLIFISAFFLQISLFGNLRPFGFVPNFLLVVAILFGFRRKIQDVLPFTFISGFLLDLLFGFLFGFHMILLAAALWLTNLASKDGKVISLSRIIFLTAVLSLVYSVFLGFNLYVSEIAFSTKIFIYLILQIGVNLFTAFLLYVFSDKFFGLLERVDTASQQKVKV